MSLQLSINLRKDMANGPGFRQSLEADPATHTAILRVYSGTVPTYVDDSVGSAVLLAEFVNGATGLSFDDAVVVGGQVIMSKAAAETWAGATIGVGGMPSFFRFTESGDVPTDATGTYSRIQGTAGPGGGFDVTVGGAYTAGVTNPMAAFDITITGMFTG